MLIKDFDEKRDNRKAIVKGGKIGISVIDEGLEFFAFEEDMVELIGKKVNVVPWQNVEDPTQLYENWFLAGNGFIFHRSWLKFIE